MIEDEKANQQIAEQKEKCGFAVAASRMEDGTHYAYTIGLTKHGLKELVIIGPNVIMCGLMIHEAAHLLIDNKSVAVKGVFELNGHRFALKDAVQSDMVKEMAEVAFEDNPALQPKQFAQLVLADPNNLLPWEEGFDARIAPHQTMLWHAGAPAGVTLH